MRFSLLSDKLSPSVRSDVGLHVPDSGSIAKLKIIEILALQPFK